MGKQTKTNTVSSMRLLGVVRLSRDTDETTSPERQKLAIEAWAAGAGHRIIGWAVDLDVSGSVAPADRPELGPWLKRMHEWDGLVVYKPDRISRSMRDFLNLYYDLDQAGKAIISVEPRMDFSTAEGRMLAKMMMVFAEYEREIIADRVKGTYRHIKVNGGYPGGQIPFGYMPVKRDGKGWAYEHDPDFAPVVRQMVDRVLSGQSMRQVALWLNAARIPTSQNVLRRRNGKLERQSSWSSDAVKKVLMSPAICGLHSEDRRPLRDEEGLAIFRCDGIITRQEWERVKKATTGPEHKTYRVDANPLLGIAVCHLCGSPLYTSRVTSRGKQWNYYRCSRVAKDGGCPAKRLPSESLIKLANDIFLAQVGDLEWGHWETDSDDVDHELAQVGQLLSDLDDEYKAGRLHATTYARITKPLEERRETLRAAPRATGEPKWVGFGITVRDRWNGLTEPQRAQMMREAGYVFYVANTGNDVVVKFQIKEYEIGATQDHDTPSHGG